MPTFTAFTTTKAREPAEALGEALEAIEPAPEGVGVFEMEDGSNLWEIGAYFTTAPDIAALALLAAVHGARDFVVSELPETDWVAKVRRDLAPVEAGRFFVYGSHDAARVPPGRIALLIEAAMAFGTGHHGTTLGCLSAIDDLGTEGFTPRRVADIGCGTAVLAMAAARLWPEAQVVASDIDAVAVEVAQANLAVNGLAGHIATIEAAGFQGVGLEGPFDLVLANILKGPLVDLAPDIAARLAPGGVAVLSGLVAGQEPEVIAAAEAAGLRLHGAARHGEWMTLRLARPA